MARAQGTYRGERRLMVRAKREADRWGGGDSKFRDIWPKHTLDCQNQPDPGMKRTEGRMYAGWTSVLHRAANATVGRRP